MITRIISSGHSGVESAALDVAKKLGIHQGGWLSKGKPRQNRELLLTYPLKETDSFGDRTAVENNIKETDGVLVITRGDTIHRLKVVVEIALIQQSQFLNVDLQQYPSFEAASLINSWIDIHKIKAVYITGAFESEVPGIYKETHKILETVCYLGYVKLDPHTVPDNDESITTSNGSALQWPQSVKESVDRLKGLLSLKERSLIANMQANELGQLRSGIGEYIKDKFGLYSGNHQLMQSCEDVGEISNPLAEEACAVIIRALWTDLTRTHKLRVIR